MHRDVDVGLGRVDHRDARVEPLVVRAPSEPGLGVGQLRSIVDALCLGGLVSRERTDVIARVVQDRYYIGEVVLALGIVGRQTPERGTEQVAPEAVDRRADLVDEKFVGRGIALFDHSRHALIASAKNASVARGILELGGEQCGRGTRREMLFHEGGDSGRTQQRSVARQHDHGVGVVGILVGPRGETHADRVTGAALHRLLHEVDGLVGPPLFLDLLGDPLRGMTNHHHRALNIHVAQRIEHVEQHRAAAQQVEWLWSL